MSISSSLKAAVSRSNELDKRLAHRIGRHIDNQSVALSELEALVDTPQPVLPPCSEWTAERSKQITDAELKLILRSNGIKGYTQRDGKRLKKADRVQLAISHGIPALTYRDLLNFYQQAVGALPNP